MKIKTKKIEKQVLGNFKGFDFSSSKTSVNPSRAIKGKNLIYKNGVNQKRNGYHQILQIKRVLNGNTVYPKINGIFNFSINNDEFLIVYAGTRFYNVTLQNGKYVYNDLTYSSTNEESMLSDYYLEDKRAFMFKNGEKVYFLGMGDIVVFQKYGNSYEFRRVFNDTDTYIPITAKYNIDGELVSSEKANLLTNYRTNIFELAPEYATASFTLSEVLDTLTRVKIEYKINVDNAITDMVLNQKVYEYTQLVDDDQNVHGEITFNNNSTVVTLNDLNINTDYPVKITFYVLTNQTNLKIIKATTGVVYGDKSGKERLFVGGSDYAPNEDFYSEADNFSYITEDTKCTLGLYDDRIMNYIHLANGTMAILKENTKDKKIFYRYPKDDTFAIESGFVGEGVKSRYSACDLMDDHLILTPSGVYALNKVKNSTNDEKFLLERGFFIKEKLLKHQNLADAVAVNYKNNYYLAIDGSVYIADPRFKSTSHNIMGDSYNYEWWYWEDVPVRVWKVMNDKLYFGTNDGKICCFGDNYTDITEIEAEQGDLLVDYEHSEIFYNTALNIKNGDKIRLNEDLYCSFISHSDITKKENGRIFVPRNKMRYVTNGRYLLLKYCPPFEGSYLVYVSDVNWSESSFSIRDARDGGVVTSGFNFDLYLSLANFPVKPEIVESGKLRLKFLYNNEDLIFENLFENSVVNVTGNIISEKNVVSEWYTPMLDFGSSERLKTLLKISVSAEASANSKIKIGYIAKNTSGLFNASGIDVFDLNTLNFNNFSFNTYFANSHTVDVKDEFNYIQFCFISDSGGNSIVNSITAIYKLSKYSQGVE